jgi:hypothetical protein
MNHGQTSANAYVTNPDCSTRQALASDRPAEDVGMTTLVMEQEDVQAWSFTDQKTVPAVFPTIRSPPQSLAVTAERTEYR